MKLNLESGRSIPPESDRNLPSPVENRDEKGSQKRAKWYGLTKRTVNLGFARALSLAFQKFKTQTSELLSVPRRPGGA